MKLFAVRRWRSCFRINIKTRRMFAKMLRTRMMMYMTWRKTRIFSFTLADSVTSLAMASAVKKYNLQGRHRRERSSAVATGTCVFCWQLRVDLRKYQHIQSNPEHYNTLVFKSDLSKSRPACWKTKHVCIRERARRQNFTFLGRRESHKEKINKLWNERIFTIVRLGISTCASAVAEFT